MSLVSGETIEIPLRRHYRLVTGTVGYPLDSIRGVQELLHATYDVFVGTSRIRLAQLVVSSLNTNTTAMRDALQKDRCIHRDLSLGNIVLVKEPDSTIRRGYLIDWESSCRVDESGKAVEPGRTVSVLRLRYSEESHTFYRAPGATCRSMFWMGSMDLSGG